MSQIKDDLICEIIRLSQTNLLGRKRLDENGECDEQKILEWIQKNAKEYRENFQVRLSEFSTSELSEILKKVSATGKELCEILEGHEWMPFQSGPSHS
jgi:hypothetical protein